MPFHESNLASEFQRQRGFREYGYATMKEPYVDLREVYAFSKTGDSGSNRSLSSQNTNLSGDTSHASNTTRANQKKKQRRLKFRKFTDWLMKFLEKRDHRVFEEAQAVIRECEERKERGEEGYESVTDSLQVPLREVVGNTYWREARFQLENFLHHSNQSMNPSGSSYSEFKYDTIQYDTTRPNLIAEPLRKARRRKAPPPASPLTTQSAWNLGKEKKIRRERFYMILRVLMKYLESKDRALYVTTKTAIHDCVARGEDYGSLLESIKIEVKHIVGYRYWRKAESVLSQAILRQAGVDAICEARSKDLLHQELLGISPPSRSTDLSHRSSEFNKHRRIVSYEITAGEQPEHEVQEFFDNACHACSSSEQSQLVEQATTGTTTESSFCFNSTTQPNSELMCWGPSVP